MSVIIADYLTDEETTQITALHGICINHIQGEIASSLSLVLSGDEDYDDTFFVLYYEDESEPPVGFLSVFCPDGWTAEISGFVHPEHRHKGYFSSLLKAGREETFERFGDVEIIYQVLSSDPDTRSFVASLGLVPLKRECMMFSTGNDGIGVEKKGIHIEGPLVNNNPLRSLLIPIFPDMSMNAVDYLRTIHDDPSTDSYRIDAPDGTPVGLFHLTKAENLVYLMGFGILPSMRRNHYAEEALDLILSTYSEGKPFCLQVSDANVPAFSLYEKAGFRVRTSCDYYQEP